MTVVPRNRQLDDFQLRMVNERLARSARRSVIARPVQDDSQLRVLLEEALGGPISISVWQERVPRVLGGRQVRSLCESLIFEAIA